METKEDRLTRGIIRKIANGKWCFDCYWGSREYPNFTSAMYKTRKETAEKLLHYKNTGKFDWYGSAE